jgi:hypothetical protein
MKFANAAQKACRKPSEEKSKLGLDKTKYA